MRPFDSYPDPDGTKSAGLGAGVCRHEYGLKLQQITGQTECAYCGMSLVDTYDHWLMMSVDHVVPQSALPGVRPEWVQNLHNLVLCCSACNGFGNRYKPAPGLPPEPAFADFLSLRDRVFEERRHLIAKRHAAERAAYAERRWEQRSSW